MSPPSGTAGNPLRDPRDRRLPRVPGPCAIVVFGVTGDLSRKKLIPAIYDLSNRGLLPPGFALLGFARRDWGDGDFEALAKKAAQEHARTESDPGEDREEGVEHDHVGSRWSIAPRARCRRSDYPAVATTTKRGPPGTPFLFEPPVGIEPTTYSLRVNRSAD